MTTETKFIDGLSVQHPREGAREFVKARLWIRRLELIAWLQAQEGDSINADIKESRNGKLYAAVDDWKPESKGGARSGRGPVPAAPASRGEPNREEAFEDDDLPFVRRARHGEL